MRDFRDAKAMAQTLRDELKAKGVCLTHSDNLELVAKVLGFHDWNTLAAKIQSENHSLITQPGTMTPTAARPTIPTGAGLPTVPQRNIALIAPLLSAEIDKKQELLETSDVVTRLEKIIALMNTDQQPAKLTTEP
jgi:uncharacterized protein